MESASRIKPAIRTKTGTGVAVVTAPANGMPIRSRRIALRTMGACLSPVTSNRARGTIFGWVREPNAVTSYFYLFSVP